MSSIIEVKQLHYTYLPGTPYERQALKNISIAVEAGDFVGIFGPNGSGKSTLARQFNGLLRPTQGQVLVCGKDTTNEKIRRSLWNKVGLVFQFPEQQIFQTTVYNEIAYGPRNLGLPEEEIRERVGQALAMVGLATQDIANLSPFSLSGGLKRRVAIAGLLALHPEILILDEPMAGLDPVGRRMIMEIIRQRRENNATTLMISHDLQEILNVADKIVILDEGVLVFFGKTSELLDHPDILQSYRLQLPLYLQVVYALQEKKQPVKQNIGSLEEAAAEIIKLFP
ncbi:MAG TPA: energy-coupling factor transporter ATPase [Syntrophomonas sp.]|nr:energy-coupling factor transporter ATPase [Syntrophomonas sp.]